MDLQFLYDLNTCPPLIKHSDIVDMNIELNDLSSSTKNIDENQLNLDTHSSNNENTSISTPLNASNSRVYNNKENEVLRTTRTTRSLNTRRKFKAIQAGNNAYDNRLSESVKQLINTYDSRTRHYILSGYRDKIVRINQYNLIVVHLSSTVTLKSGSKYIGEWAFGCSKFYPHNSHPHKQNCFILHGVEGKLITASNTENSVICSGRFEEHEFVEGKVESKHFIWIGPWINKQARGKGQLELLDSGDIFEGIINDSEFETGKYWKKETGVVFEGTFSPENHADECNGMGKLIFPENNEAGIKHYEGTVKNCEATGNGVMTYNSGAVVKGTFKNNQIVKVRLGTKKNESLFTSNQVHLIESQQIPIGARTQYNKFTGKYDINGLKTGFGTFEWNDEFDQQYKYKGYWENDLMQGQGKLLYYDNFKFGYVQLSGEFKQGYLCGTGKAETVIYDSKADKETKSQLLYEGEFNNNLFSGLGKLFAIVDSTDLNSGYTVANFENNSAEGKGFYVYTRVNSWYKPPQLSFESLWIGSFKNGRKFGVGCLISNPLLFFQSTQNNLPQSQNVAVSSNREKSNICINCHHNAFDDLVSFFGIWLDDEILIRYIGKYKFNMLLIMKKLRNYGMCSFLITGTIRTRQIVYICITCTNNDNMNPTHETIYLCQTCVEQDPNHYNNHSTCHLSHNIEYVGYKWDVFCRCGCVSLSIMNEILDNFSSSTPSQLKYSCCFNACNLIEFNRIMDTSIVGELTVDEQQNLAKLKSTAISKYKHECSHQK